MKTLLIIFLASITFSCNKDIYDWEPMPQPNYEICNVRIDSIMIDPDTLLPGFPKWLNLKVQYYKFHTRDSVWLWCDIFEPPVIHWGDHTGQFSFIVDEPDMAIKIEPATCPGVIQGFNIYIGDSLVRVRKEGKFFRIRLNN
jgi:hypothetical protein